MSDTASLESALTAPPADGPDICSTCRSWRPDGQTECDNCAENSAVLGTSAPVIPISLYRKPSPLRDWLTYYKPNDDVHHPEYAVVLATILSRWADAHASALSDWCEGYDTICVVPSATRSPPHPLERVIDDYVPFLANQRRNLLLRGEGVLGHRSPSLSGYVPTAELSGMRVLLIDDVYTTGARSQSAAYALLSAGAVVPAILVIGRRINPDWRTEVAAIWERQSTISFHFEN